LSVDAKRRKTIDLYMKERERKPNADCQSRSPMPTAKAGAQCRVPVPSPPPCHGGRRGRWGQARLVGAGETGGGRRGWWGQARPMGAVSLRPYARARQHQTLGKPPGQIPSQHELTPERHSQHLWMIGGGWARQLQNAHAIDANWRCCTKLSTGWQDC
jgi:hypothetical protein